jgi:hypothetical protein
MWYVVLTFKDDIFRSDFLRSFMQFQHHNITSDNVHIEVISIQKLINIDRRKLVEILVLFLKEVINRFISTIELCHIWNFCKHFFHGTLFLATTNAVSELIWPQYVHYQCPSRRWNQNLSVWDILFKWLKLC